ncbi:MAG: hypothetical protein ACKO4T_13070 [Planctomycetaceae bacterium]
MRFIRSLCIVAVTCVAPLVTGGSAEARNPPNPYSSFNLSGINYGSMQWEKDQRQGKRVWPSYTTPARGYSRGNAFSVGGSGGVVRGNPRRWRR